MAEVFSQEKISFKEPTSKQPKVFLSWSYKDKDWMEEAVTSLKPLSFLGMIDTQVDTQIKVCDDWFEEITKALTSADIGTWLRIHTRE